MTPGFGSDEIEESSVSLDLANALNELRDEPSVPVVLSQASSEIVLDPKYHGTLIESQLGDDFSEEADDSCSDKADGLSASDDFGVTEEALLELIGKDFEDDREEQALFLSGEVLEQRQSSMSAISAELNTPLKPTAAAYRMTMNSVNLMERSATANKSLIDDTQKTEEQPSSVKP